MQPKMMARELERLDCKELLVLKCQKNYASDAAIKGKFA